MKIGFNLLLWTGRVRDEHLPIIEDIRRTGYDGVEIPLFEGTPDDYAALGRRLDALELGRTAVAVFPTVDVNPIGPDPAQQAGARRHITWVLDCAQALGATHVVGPIHSTIGHFSGHGPTQRERALGIAYQRDAGDLARVRGIVLGVEALNRFECYFLNTMADLASFIAEVDHPNVRAIYDTFHANIEEKHPLAAIDVIAPYLAHVHISENDRGTPGRGHIDMHAEIQALKATGYDGWFTIEAFGRGLPQLAAATRVWRDFFPAPEQVYREGIVTIRHGWAG
jgi:D-psicose/D-tagatose/L-ribulose 3-epimerase